MPELTIDCERCGEEFNPRENKTSAGPIIAVGVVLGAAVGAKVGIVLGSYGTVLGGDS